LHRVIVFPGVKRHQAHQMQAVGVIAVDRQRLLAGGLCVLMPSGAQMAQAGFKECGRMARAKAVLSCLGRSGPCPAVATVYRHISMEQRIHP
jgi:hypothetical protein